MLSRNLLLKVHRSLNLTRLLIPTRSLSSHSPHPLKVAAQRHRRHTSNSAALAPFSELSTDRYHELSNVTMDNLLDSLESLLDEIGNSIYEVEYHSGVLTLNLGDKGTYVINKQPPNKQIWFSSPFSGPKRYDYSVSKDEWLYARDGKAMSDLLEDELSRTLDMKVTLGIRKVSESKQRS